jgi:hypothetical protein
MRRRFKTLFAQLNKKSGAFYPSKPFKFTIYYAAEEFINNKRTLPEYT